MVSAYRALYVAWQGHDDFSGPDEIDGTMHLSMEDYKAYMKVFMATEPAVVPSYYIRPSQEPRWTDIPVALCNKLVRAHDKGQFGLRVSIITKTTYRAR